MKKALLILTAMLALSSVVYADSNDGNNGYYDGHMMGRGYYQGRMMGSGYMMRSGYGGRMMDGYHRGMYDNNRYMQQRTFTQEEEKAYIKMMENNLKIQKKYEIKIRKNQLDLESELLKENPDWEKVQKINEELGSLEAKFRTEMMKSNYRK